MFVNFLYGSRNDVDSGELTYPAGGLGGGVHGGLHGADIPPYMDRDEATFDFFIFADFHIGGFNRGVGCLDAADKSDRFDHSECLTHIIVTLKSFLNN